MAQVIGYAISYIYAAFSGVSVASLSAGAIAAIGYISTAIYYAGVYLYAKGAMSKAKGQLTAGSPISMYRDPAPVARVVYGRRRVSGPVLFVHAQGGAANSKLHLVLGLTCHELSAIESFYVNDEAVSAPSQEAIGRLSGSFFVNRHLGGDSQTAEQDLVDQSGGRWTSAHRLQGISYLYCQLLWNQDKFPTGLPNISAIVQGKPVLDYRSGETAWSSNPALILYDYLTNTRFGCAFASDEFDMSAWIAAANACDEEVALDAGGTQPRYRCDAVFDTDSEPATIIEEILATMAGQIAYSAGKWIVHAGVDRPVVLALSRDDLAGPIQVRTRDPIGDAVNIVRGTYSEPGDNWLERDFAEQRNAMYIGEDGGWELPRDVAFSFVTDAYQAQRLARIQLESGRQDISIKAVWKLKAIAAAPGDVVHLDFSERYGWGAKPFVVLGWSFTVTESGALAIAMDLREYSAAIWQWNAEETTTDLSPNTDLPTPWLVPPPTSLSISSASLVGTEGGARTVLLPSWTVPADAFVQSGGRIEIEWQGVGEPQWTPAGSVPGNSTTATITGAVAGRLYNVRVRSVSGGFGVRSEWLAAGPHVAAGDTVAPDPPSALQVWSPNEVAIAPRLQGSVQAFACRLTWTPSPSKDVAYYEVFVRTFGSSPPLPLQQGSRVPVHMTESDYYTTSILGMVFWVRAVDHSGNAGNFAGPSINLNTKLGRPAGSLVQQESTDVRMSALRIGAAGASGVAQVRAVFPGNQVVELVGGAATEDVDISLANRGFSAKPTGCRAAAIGGTNFQNFDVNYHFDAAGSTAANAVVRISLKSGGTLPAQPLRISYEFFETA